MSASWSLRIPIEKLDTARGIATGWAAISTDDLGEPVVDHDGDYIPIEELAKAAQDAFLNHGPRGAIGDMHTKQGGADLVESFVLDNEKRKALGLGDPKEGHPSEGWIVSFQMRDPEMIKDVRSGARQELSIRGSAESIDLTTWERSKGRVAKSRKPTSNANPSVLVNLQLNTAEMLSTVDQGASGNHRVSPKIVLVKRKGSIMGLLSKWFKNDKLIAKADSKETRMEALAKLTEDLTEDQRGEVAKALSHEFLKLEGSPQQMLEAALEGLDEKQVAAIMAAFQLALMAPAGEAPKAAEPKTDPEPAPTPDAPAPDKETPDPKEPEEMEKVIKTMSPEGRQLLEKVLANNEAKDKRLETLEKSNEEEIAKSRRRDAVSKARELVAVPASEEDLVELLIDIEKLDEKSRDRVMKILGDSDTAIKSGLLKQRGKDGAAPAAGSAMATAISLSKEIQKSRTDMTKAQIMDKVWKDNPELYNRYIEEQKSN